MHAGASWCRRDSRSWNSVWEDRIFMPTGAGKILFSRIHPCVCEYWRDKTVIINILSHPTAAWPRSLNEEGKSEDSHSISQPGHSWKSYSRSGYLGWPSECITNKIKWNSSLWIKNINCIIFVLGWSWDLLCWRWGIQAAVHGGPQRKWLAW